MNENGNYTIEDVKLDKGEISYEDWVARYKPVKNHISKYTDKHSEFDSFETYGEEMEHVLAQPVNNVWTEVHADFCILLIPGVSIVNRLCYFICEEPWTNEDEVVVATMDIECYCYDEEANENGDRDEYGDPECKHCEGYGFRTVDTDDEEVKQYRKENA